MTLFFRDNFFSMGETEILGSAGEAAGRIDLKGAFSSSLDVYDAADRLAYSGRFTLFSGRWTISNCRGEEVGKLRPRFSLSTKRFEYDARQRGVYEIRSPIFSKEYEIFDSSGQTVAHFEKTSGFFSSDAFRLTNSSPQLDDYELVAVVMGLYAIQKHDGAAGSSAST
ncbi:hypothetical protein [Gorillibacterium sp. CAU 1737]|uniref:hypothetical protein n=1 Tax=Gorillibacterium sp. CAU 1737 TaxID=3140362 RepID=UPI0032617EF5